MSTPFPTLFSTRIFLIGQSAADARPSALQKRRRMRSTWRADGPGRRRKQDENMSPTEARAWRWFACLHAGHTSAPRRGAKRFEDRIPNLGAGFAPISIAIGIGIAIDTLSRGRARKHKGRPENPGRPNPCASRGHAQFDASAISLFSLCTRELPGSTCLMNRTIFVACCLLPCPI